MNKNILIRNSSRVGECMLVSGDDYPLQGILDRPEIKRFIDGRKVLNMEVSRPQIDGTTIIDLDLTLK